MSNPETNSQNSGAKKKQKGSFWAKPGRAATLSMWSAILCVAFSVWYIYPKNESLGMICTCVFCVWAGSCLVRADQQRAAAKGGTPKKNKAVDYVRKDSILGMLLGKNKKP